MPPKSTIPEVERFWFYVDQSAGPDACWLWRASRLKSGYGQFVRDGRVHITAHRYALIASGQFLVPGDVVCHRCDNPPCCNPAHLFVGTQQQNLADMIAKGRRRITSKLTAADVPRIRAAYAAGRYQRELAEQFGVTQTTIGRLVRREAWRD